MWSMYPTSNCRRELSLLRQGLTWLPLSSLRLKRRKKSRSRQISPQLKLKRKVRKTCLPVRQERKKLPARPPRNLPALLEQAGKKRKNKNKYDTIKTMVKKAIVFVLIAFIFAPFLSAKPTAAFDCLQLTSSSSQSDKDYCKKELNEIEAQLRELLEKQKAQQKQTGTLKGDVAYLQSQIDALRAKIKSRALIISQLKVDIAEKSTQIKSLSQKIERDHESLAQLLRNTNEFDNETIIHLVLSDESLSNFYSDLESYSSIKRAVKESVDNIRGIKTETEEAKGD